jgi:single-stranded-DNA-specific exonuclease
MTGHLSGFLPLVGVQSHLGRPWRIHRAALDVTGSARPLLHRFLSTRGLVEPSAVEDYLSYSLANMCDPALMPDATQAAERILDAISNGEQVTVYGDYDVDGVTSAAVLSLALKSMFGFTVHVYIPHRLKEGYGLNKQAIRQIADGGTTLIITVDNGSSAQAETALAQSLGLDVIIVDHHQVSDPEPVAIAHLNPHRGDSSYPYKGLAAVGIAFMLLVELRRRADAREGVSMINRRIDTFLDLVALGTVADVAPLTDINRALVRYGLGQIKAAPRIGVEALCRVSGVEPDAINEGDLGFKLGPRVNAAGRLENAADGFVLLTEDDGYRAKQMAIQIDEQNAQRRVIQKRIEEEALIQAEALVADGKPEILILHGNDWHPGVVGIVASRIVEVHQLPVFCLALDGNIWKGSGRSVPGVNLKALLDHCGSSLLRYGGHVAAAGVTLNVEALETFKSMAQSSVHLVRDEHAEQVRYVDVDAELNLGDLNFELLEGFESAGPFGHENPLPKFLVKNVSATPKVMRGNHLKLVQLNLAAPYVEAIGWNMGDCASICEASVDLVCTARIESWRGRRRITLTVIDLRSSTVDGGADE